MANPIERIGQIPEDWNVEKANQHLILESGMRPAEFVTDHPSDIPSLGGENIDLSGNLVFDNVRYISKEYYSRMPKGKVQDEDILINKDGANTGKIAFAKAKPFVECAVNEHVFLIRNKGAFDQEYLFYFLYSDKGSRQIQRKIVGSAQGGINNSFTKGLLIPKPPKNEQKAIATILSKVDEAIKATENSIKAAEKLKKSLMQNLLTGKLKPDGTWRKEDEFYKDEKFGNVPLGWEMKKVKEISNCLDSLRKPIKASDRKEIAGEYRYYGAASIIDYINDFIFDGRYILFGEDGENLISRKLPQAFIVEGKFWVNNHAHILESIEGISDLDYLCYQLEFKNYENIVYGSAQPKINKSDLNKIRVLIPEQVGEQIEISNCIKQMDQIIENKKQKEGSLKNLKKSLMQNLLTGKVRVDLDKIEKANSE